MSTPDGESRRIFTEWAEKMESQPYTFIAPFSPPSYVPETLTERVEPYATQYNELCWEHPYEKDCDCGPPDPEWYTPTPKLLELEARMDALKAKAFRKVPNPDYDETKAAEWREKRQSPYNATTIKMGQSYNPEWTKP